ncbi:hypothetical protein GCM10018962_00360 [Dactylosporangium matsuzakiense]|uniref:Uncharacterized protein n=1 Tax=Dactylosporangium matsuzakiense TaxID=53360 RepID=A0A9W6KEZ1_9ACTN|nr:hypothetical protein GCM10017581_018180 [Dactylosporangium matsuzakiense]
MDADSKAAGDPAATNGRRVTRGDQHTVRETSAEPHRLGQQPRQSTGTVLITAVGDHLGLA